MSTDDILSDEHIDAFVAALKRGQGTASDEEITIVLLFARELVLAAAELAMVERGEVFIRVESGEVVLGLVTELVTEDD